MKTYTHKKNIKAEGGFRTKQERLASKELEKIFNQCPDSVETRLDNFPKYIKRQKLTKLLALYEIFKKILHTKGSVVECGVFRGFGLMSWAHISAILEPTNLTRRIYGFDTFKGFPSISKKDNKKFRNNIKKGDLRSNSFNELQKIIKVYDQNRFLEHITKVELIKGDATKTIPEFIKKNPHLVVSLLFLDFDLFEPTKVAIENFYPRMPKGSVIAFDELDNPLWPGETLALLEKIGINKLKIERFRFDPYVGYAVL